MVQTRKSRAGRSPDEDPSLAESTSRRRSEFSSSSDTPVKMEASGFDPKTTPIILEEDATPSRSPSKPQTRSETPRKPVVIYTRSTRPRSAAKKTWRSFFATIGLLYLGATYALTCHGTKESTNPVCKAFYAADEARSEALAHLNVYAKPHLDRASAYVEPYVAAVRPHYTYATNAAKPYATQASTLYKTRVQPQIVQAQKKAQAAASPYISQAHVYHKKSLEPQLRHYRRVGAKFHADHVGPNLQKGKKLAQPHVDYAQKVLGPGAQRYFDQVAVPFATKSYRTTRETYIRDVHPRVLSSWSQIVQFLRHRLVPILSRFNAVYIRPQIDRVMEKIFEAKTKKAATEAIVEAEIKERKIAVDGKEDELDAFIESLRSEVVEAEDAQEVEKPIVGQKSKISDAEHKANKAKLASLTAEKRKKLEAERDRFEHEIEQLAVTERLLLIERLNSIRAAAVRDIPARFESRINDIKHEANKLLGKLERHFERVAQDENADIEEKIADADLISSKAVNRLSNRAEEVHDELDQYGRDHYEKEAKAVTKALEAVHTMVAQAQDILGTGWAWLDDVSVDDWKRYHRLQKREDEVHGQFRAIAAGQANNQALDADYNPIELVLSFKDNVDDIVDKFEASLDQTSKAGAKRLRGSVGDSVRAAYQSAKSALGVEVPVSSPSGMSASLSSAYSVVSGSAASIADSMASNIPDAAGAAAMAHEATRAVSRALGGTSTPENARDYVDSLYARASEGVFGEAPAAGISASLSSVASGASVSVSSAASEASASAASVYANLASSLPDQDALSSHLHSATRAAARAVGVTPSPEGVGEHIESVYARVSGAVKGEPSAADYTASASSIMDGVRASASSLASAASASAASAYEQAASSLPAADDLSSSLHSATRAAARAVGATPSPEGVGEHIDSLYARASKAVAGEPPAAGLSASASSLAGVASSVVASASSEGSRTLSSLYAFQLPSASDVTSSLSSVASVVGDGAQSAYQAASRAIDPSAVSASASSLLSEVSGTASSVGSSASSVLHDATRAAYRAAGGEPSPENVQEHIASVSRAVSRKLAPSPPSAGDRVDEAVQNVREAAQRVRQRVDL